MRSDKLSIFQGHPIDNAERLCKKTNEEISCGQTSKQEFGRRMKRRHLAKCNEDHNIANSCSDAQKNVEG